MDLLCFSLLASYKLTISFNPIKEDELSLAAIVYFGQQSVYFIHGMFNNHKPSFYKVFVPYKTNTLSTQFSGYDAETRPVTNKNGQIKIKSLFV